MKTQTVQAAACIFVLAAACYLLSFSGVPISDDEELYAGAARSLAVQGTLSAGQLTGNARLAGSFHGVEPAFPALASVWMRMFVHSGIGHLQSLYLLPVFCTALSAALIVVIAVQLGFRLLTAAAAGVLYGMSSMAWPYAKTLFREPLMALLLLASLMCFLWLLQKGRHGWQSSVMAALLLLLLATLAFTRVVMLTAALALLLTASVAHPALQGRRKQVLLATAGLIAVGALTALAVGLASSQATDADIFYRFTSGFVRDALTRLNSMPHSHFTEALLAPLISPWKGLVFYSPICLPGLACAVKNMRRRPEMCILPVALLVMLLLEQALAYDDEWWTPTWGSRFLVPVIPLLAVAALPAVDWMMRPGRGRRVLPGSLFLAGFIIQLPAVLFNSAAFTAASYHQVADAFPGPLTWNPGGTPILAQWQAAGSQEPDLLLWRIASARPGLAALAVVLALGLITGAILLLRGVILDGPRKKWALLLSSGLVLCALGLSAVVMQAGTYDPAYHLREFQPVCAYLRNNLRAADILIVQPYPGDAWQSLMNEECGQGSWYSLPYEDAPNSATLAQALVSSKIPSGTRYWLVRQTWTDAAAPDTASPLRGSDRLLQMKTFDAPYPVLVAAYQMGQP